ncbi:MAG: ATP-binding protein [Candidatus Binatia bacterium]
MMKLDAFSGKVEVLHQRLRTLRQQNAAPVRPKLSIEILEELGTALEELHVAQAELQQQNEELIATRHTVETERQRYQELFEFAPDGYLVTDAQGMIREANRAAAAFLQVRQTFLIGKPFVIFMAAGEREALRVLLTQLQEGSPASREWEVRLQPREAQPFSAALTVVPAYDSRRKVAALRWLLRDITARKRAEEELREAHDKLERRVQERTVDLRQANETLRAEIVERQRIEKELRHAKEAAESANRAKTEFLATMSHELRTPLHIIMGYTDLMMEGEFGAVREEQKDRLRRMKRSTYELLDLITAALDISRLEAGRLPIDIKEVQIAALLDELQEETQGLQEHSALDFVWQVEPDLPCIRTDLEKLKIVLKNLIGNAVKFTKEGSITIMARSRGGGIEISTADTGIGIPREELLTIFDPFQQGENSTEGLYKGAGLGLHIVKRMLTLLGGRIEVESDVGQGSTFRVWVPIDKDH